MTLILLVGADDAGAEYLLRHRMLIFNTGGKNRLFMSARAKHAYVWQRGRFDGDAQFWHERLGSDVRIDPVAEGRALRVFLETTPQFEAFWKAVGQELAGKSFINEPPLDSDEAIEDETGQAA
jgi:hypothetical protein